jgi:hypothetical protein
VRGPVEGPDESATVDRSIAAGSEELHGRSRTKDGIESEPEDEDEDDGRDSRTYGVI